MGRPILAAAAFLGGQSRLKAGCGQDCPPSNLALQKLYADKANWPSPAKQQMQPFRISPEVWGFIERAIAARKRG